MKKSLRWIGQSFGNWAALTSAKRNYLFGTAGMQQVHIPGMYADGGCDRYILWAMNKYRLGQDPKKFAHEAKPKKTIRGWVPSSLHKHISLQVLLDGDLQFKMASEFGLGGSNRVLGLSTCARSSFYTPSLYAFHIMPIISLLCRVIII